MVFSGEIYNRQYLRDYLRKKGHSFRTGEDAEIIVHLYEEFREKCLRHINGVFAVSLWDKKRKILFLARDRTGIKPLFYAVLNDQIIFASKIKAILSYPGFPRDMDWAAFSHYLSFYYISSPRSIYQHIKRLPVGHERMSVDFLLKSFTRGAHFQLEKAHMHYKEIFSEEERGIY